MDVYNVQFVQFLEIHLVQQDLDLTEGLHLHNVYKLQNQNKSRLPLLYLEEEETSKKLEQQLFLQQGWDDHRLFLHQDKALIQLH